MSLGGRQWIWPDHDLNLVTGLCQSLNLTPVQARLLINRGITDPAQARAFLYPSRDQFHAPWLLQGMEQAVKRLLEAVGQGQKIMIYGDYDADGIAAAAIMVEALRRLGSRVDYYLPSRFGDGYGLHIEPLRQFKAEGASLVVTVDCGINACEEASFAAASGLDLIITDHHQPLDPLPAAVSVINPLQPGCPYPFKDLSGAGVAFKLASALLEKAGEPFPDHLLDLAALGTAADVVPLLGENRAIVYFGLEVLRAMGRTGFRALAAAVSLDREQITGRTLSYVLAPNINAAGRMGEAYPAAGLLLEDNPDAARELADKLLEANRDRRSKEQRILVEAEEAAIGLLAGGEQKIITLAGENWHHGVIGIVASRLVDKYNRPFCLIALDGEEGRGSARSIPGFDITAALHACSGNLERFGGHEQAAGFKIRTEQVDGLREDLIRYARLNLEDSALKPRLHIEAELKEQDIDFALTAWLEQLQPFGTANPAPLFASRGWDIQDWRLVGSEQKHLKLSLRKGRRSLDPIVFSGSSLEPHLGKGRRVDMALRLKNGFWRDHKTLEAEVKDLSYSDSFSCGDLELIDRRSCPDRLSVAGEIIDRNGPKTIVFASTTKRLEPLKKSCLITGPPCFITSGSLNGAFILPEGCGPLVLYDLPLFEGILEPVFSKGPAQKPLTVYLLYNRSDLKRNRRLLDLSLPSKELLDRMVAVLPGVCTAPETFVFPGPLLDRIDFKPAPSFWARVEKIFAEAGLFEDGRPAPNWEEALKNWPAGLDSSPAYRAAAKLRAGCEQFQQLLLEAPPQEIAARLRLLAAN